MLGAGRRFKVLTVRQIPLYVSASFLVLAAFVVLLNASADRRSDDLTALLDAAIEFGLLFAVVLIHEASHAVVARLFDVPVSGITLTFWGGATETPADSKGPLAGFLIAFAGPASTLVLAGVCFAVAQQLDPGQARSLAVWLFGVNLFLAFLNLIPGYPLDGGRMLEATAWGITKNRSTSLKVAGWAGVVVGLGFIVLAVVRFSEDGYGVIWLGFIGLVVLSIGRAMPQRVAVRERLGRGTVRQAMRPPGDTIAAGASLSEALDSHLRAFPDRAFPVVEDGKVAGIISMSSARRIGSRDPMRPVRDAMRPLNQVMVLDPDVPLSDANEWLGGHDGLVLRDGVLLGMIGPADIQAWAEPGPTIVTALPPRPDV